MKRDRLLILGGGITGLATALAIHRFFHEVVVVERDEYPDGTSERRFTPQGQHIHVLLSRGVTELFESAPELAGWFDDAGFPEKDLTADIWVAQGGRWLPRKPCGIPTRSCTRPFLEAMLRRAVKQRPAILIRERTTVSAILGNGNVDGVVVDTDGRRDILSADLVVDARGRSSKVASTLHDLGHGQTTETVVDAKVAYASCVFEPHEGVELPCSILAAIGTFGTDPRIGTLMSIGPRKWLATLINYAGSCPPRDVSEFMKQASMLCVPDLHRELLKATPVSKVVGYKNTANRRRNFQHLKSWPKNYVVLGDAVCTFNPRFGQGITMASIGAKLLADCLQDIEASAVLPHEFTTSFQRSLNKKLNSPWIMATTEDKGWEAQIKGASTLTDRIRIALSSRILETAANDFDTYIRINRVAHMIDPVSALINPRTLLKTIAPAMRRLDSM